jgi:hypothetical protein
MDSLRDSIRNNRPACRFRPLRTQSPLSTHDCKVYDTTAGAARHGQLMSMGFWVPSVLGLDRSRVVVATIRRSGSRVYWDLSSVYLDDVVDV